MRSQARAILGWRAGVAALCLLFVVAALVHSRRASPSRLPAAFLDPASLPDGRIVYARSLVPGDGAAPVALHTALPDGREERRITFGDAQDGMPRLLPDGRIVFRRRARRDDPGRLFAINPDGTGLQLFRLADGESIQHGARPLALTSVVDERKSTGTLLCLDVRTSDIPAVAAAKPGAVRLVRVFAGDGRRLGEAPVEADGSFFIEVPADQPLRLELHGPDGVLAADHSGFWVRPSENRGCIGCHEDPELAPENRMVLALVRGPTPIGATALAMHPEARQP